MSEGEKQKKKTVLVGMTSIMIAGILLVATGILVACDVGTIFQTPVSGSTPESRPRESSSQESSLPPVETVIVPLIPPQSETIEVSTSSSAPVTSSSSVVQQNIKPLAQTSKERYITKAGNYTEQERYSGDLWITSDNVVLSDTIVEGSVYLNVPNLKGYIDLLHVVVKGDIVIVEGSPMVTMDNVTARSLKIAGKKGSPTVELRNAAEIPQTIIMGDAYLREVDLFENNGGFSQIFVEANVNKYWYELYLDVQGDQVITNFPVNLRLLEGTRLSQVYAQKPTHLYDTGKADHLYVKAEGVSYRNVTRVHEDFGYTATQGGASVAENSSVAGALHLAMPSVSPVPQISNGVVSFSFIGVENALYYEINTYKNGVLAARHLESISAGTQCVVLSHLGYQTGDYVYFEVTAVGDGVQHLHSPTVATAWITV